MYKAILKAGVLLFALAMSVNVLFAEEAVVPEATPIAPTTQVQPIYVFGEVVAVNTELSEITIQYYDYELNDLKEMVLAVDTNSVFENFQNLSEIAAGDTVNVEYNVAEEKNLIQKISVEKAETEESLDQPLDAGTENTESQPQTN